MADGAGPLLSLRGVTVDVNGVRALDGVDLDVHAGERVAVVGPSGAGKTTLLSVVNGSVRPSAGSVTVLGEDVAALEGRRARAVRRRVGTVRQQLDLVGPLRVVHNVNAGKLGEWSLARALWALARPGPAPPAHAALARVGIAGKLHERTDRLSGGEQQRVALARLLVQDPLLLLADEPVASLDPARAREVVGLLCDVAAAGGRALVVSLHAFELALEHCDRVVGLRNGRVLFDLPAAAVTAELAGTLYQLDSG